ncbi:hypothetical protein ACTJIJ_19765 [Niabella sp. 22666]|uniref:hypothetical protein n=1 Tax=Niabella sp. 22666 TaxID=3453954 RepID=UPI003F8724F9
MSRYLPILFSTPMVQALDAKTMTRRICKHQFWSFSELVDFNDNRIHSKVDGMVSSKYQIGDILWVKEAYYAFGWWVNGDGTTKSGLRKMKFIDFTSSNNASVYVYETDADKKQVTGGQPYKNLGWYKRNSLFMPKKAARHFLKVLDVKVERLHDITDADCISEGIEKEQGFYRFYPCNDLRDNTYIDSPNLSFYSLWESINGVGSWAKNPWVFAYTFEKVTKPENFPG